MKTSLLTFFVLLILAAPGFAEPGASPNFDRAAPGGPAPGWEGSGVVESEDGSRVLHLAGREDNDVAVTPPIPVEAGKSYLVSFRLRLTVEAGALHVQYRCLDAARHVIKPEWLYPTIEVFNSSLPQAANFTRRLPVMEEGAAFVQIVFKWWATPSGEAWISGVGLQPVVGRPVVTAARPVDLRAVCNRALVDLQGPGVGPQISPGTKEVAGLPLVILDLAANGGRSCIALDGPAPRTVRISVGQRAERVYALHDALHPSTLGEPAALWTFHYMDGTQSSVTIRFGEDLVDWRRPMDTSNSAAAFLTADRTRSPVGLNLAEILNPAPEKTIGWVEVASAGSAGYVLASMTLADGESIVPWLRQQPTIEFHKAAGDWFPAPLPWGAAERPSPTDVSWLLDKPAGKHGFVEARNGQFRFQDGTRARFLATTAGWSSWAVSHADAERMAAYLSRLGVNLLRIYPEGILSGSDPQSFTLDADKQEKLDYLLSQLRSRGIYVYFYTSIVQFFYTPLLDPLTHGTRSMNRSLGLFDPGWIAAEERYWRLLLGHVNPYTGRSLAQDPMLAMLVLTNENELFDTALDDSDPIPPAFRAELAALWNRWLLAEYGSRERLAAAWARMGAAPLVQEEDPAKGSVELPDRNARGRIYDFRQFCADTQRRWTAATTGSLRAEGVRCPVQFTNSIYTPEGVFEMADADFSNFHLYGPYQDGRQWTEENYSVLQVGDPLKGNLWSFPDADQMGRLAGKPFVFGEWNVGYPNDFRGGGLVQAFAYGLLQDWDCLNYFCFFEDGEKLRPGATPVTDSLESAFDPGRAGLFPALALLFYRQDISPAREAVYRRLTHADIAGMERAHDYGGSLQYARPDIAWIPFVHRYAIAPEPLQAAGGTVLTGTDPGAAVRDLRGRADQQGLIDEAAQTMHSDNREVSSDFTHGYLTIDTERTQGASGSLDEAGPIHLGGLEIQNASTFCTVLLSSLDGAPLESSSRILVTVIGDAANSGEAAEIDRSDLNRAPAEGRLHPFRYGMDGDRAGTAPMVAEPVSVAIRLRRAPGAPALRCQSLNPAGDPTGVVPVQRQGGWMQFQPGGEYHSLYYLLGK